MAQRVRWVVVFAFMALEAAACAAIGMRLAPLMLETPSPLPAARADQAEEVMHIMEREMRRAGEAILKMVPILAEAAVADYWSK